MQHDRERAIRSIVRVAFSNAVKVLAGVLVGFLLPRIMNVEDYGFYKICTLYAAYVGLFSTGMVDGIALHWGGCDLGQIDRGQFRLATRIFLLLELAVAAAAAGIGCTLQSAAARAVLLYLSVFLLTNNITSYFQTLSQCAGRFRELSRCNMAQSLLNALLIGVLCLLHTFARTEISAALYLVSSTGVNLTMLAVYLMLYRGMVFGETARLKLELPLVRSLILTGLPLMIANLCDLLMLSIDRQFVSTLFATEVYAVYAFAYNIVTMVTMVISAISTVLYPLLKRADAGELRGRFNPLCGAIIAVTSVCLLLYDPLVLFIPWFLPAYSDSLSILRAILPGLLFSSVTTIVLQNYCKTMALNLPYCVISLLMLALSAAADLAAYRLFGTTQAISYASVLVLACWMDAVLLLLGRKGMAISRGNLLSLHASAAAFLLCTADGMPLWTGFGLNALCVCGILRFHMADLKTMLHGKNRD